MDQKILWAVNQMPKTDDKNLPIMGLEEIAKARTFHESFPQYTKTPLTKLDHMAAYLGVKEIYLKDESYRFGLNAFKVLGGSFSMARYIAKNLGAAGLADACQLQLAYAIGVAHPVSVLVETYGTGKMADEKLAQLVRDCFDLRPAAIIRRLDLRRPIYRQTAAYGHFGRADLDLPWEKTDMVQDLLAKA